MAEDFDADPHDEDVFAPVAAEGFKHVHVDTAQGITRVTLNRAPANVLSLEMMQEVAAAIEGLEYQKDVKAVTLFAAGKYFSAGFELGDHLGDRAYMMLEAFRRITEAIAKVDKPTIAVVAGPALGAGCMLAAACDMVIAAAQAAKFGFPEIRGGVFNTVAAAVLPRIVGRKRAFEMLLLGTTLTAADAERIGLVTRTVPDDRLAAEVAGLVQRFQDSSAPVLQLVRRAIAGGLDLPYEDAVRHAEDVYLNQLLGTQDVEEGLRAVSEKRKPAWKDR
jgi:cyclohexa-1,5-dienecarbonyl-CoA hydratase